jgi:hypothetical protein
MAGVKRTVESIANAAIIIVCCMLGWTLVTHKSIHFGAQPVGFAETHLEGQTLPPPSGYNWGSRPETLVLVIRKGCKYCEASLPFYTRLGELEKGNSLRAHVLAVMPDDKESGTRALQSAGSAFDSIFNQPLDSMKVSATPTLLLLDSRGRVMKSWVGQLGPGQEEDVIATAEK